MKATRFCSLLLCLVLLLSLTACEEGRFIESTTIAKQTTTTPMNENDNPSQKPEESPDAPTAPEMLGFSTFDEIERFVAAANGSADAYAEFINGLEHSFTAPQIAAQTIATHLTSAELPRPANAQSAEDFGCTYYADRVELDLIYRMKGIRYRFVYSYLPSEPHTYEGEPILTGLSLGSVTLDLYPGTNCLVGSYQSGQTAVRVIVYTEQAADVDFGQFDFQSIAVQ
ncbi:MAG: hypothetical protein IJW98_03405 [Clostridia bacterium]|nr:hypothetical protein [Clostridia bacterium]